MANFRSIYKVQVLLTILVHLTVALYEDQVGKFDWKRSFIGKAKFASFEARRIIVATEENVLASLSLETGDIQWRQVLEDPSGSQIEFLQVGKEILTISGSNNTWLVRSWEISSGSLLDEWPLSAERTVPSAFTAAAGKLFHVVPIKRSHLEISVYSSATSRHARKETRRVVAPWIGDSSTCATANSYYACLTPSDLFFINLLEEDASFVSTPLQKLSEVDLSRASLLSFKHEVPSVLLVEENSAALVVFREGNAQAKGADWLAPNAFSINENGKRVIYQLEANEDEDNLIRVSAKDDETGADLHHFDLAYRVGLGTPLIMGGQTIGGVTDLLLTTTDNALLLVRLPQGVLWTKEEALSNIVAAEFFELPISELDASIEHEFDFDSNILTMFSRRISTQLNQLYSFVLGDPLSRLNSGLVRDEFGLHKIIVVATKAGKLFGIDTWSGSIVWSYRLPRVQPFLGVGGKETMLLLVQRTAQYAPLAPQCVLLAQDQRNGRGVLFQFNPITGHSLEGVQRLNYKIAQGTLLNYHDRNFLKPLLVLSDSNEALLYSGQLNEELLRSLQTTFVYTVDEKRSTLRGQSFKYSSREALKLTTTWEVDLAPSRILSVSAKPANERVHSQGKVLFDRSVYYKYVNPNLLAVATVSADQIHRSVVSVYLIDGVSGLVLHSTAHKKAKGPVHLIHSENWLVYTYFNERFRRMEMEAIELYEGHLQSNSTVFSSFAVSQLPEAQSQSYILPATPVEMAVTLTERGITNKFLLIALSNGAVVEVPWMMLQPRFPGMPCGAEESCIPYMPEVPLHPEAIINYNQSLGRIRGIEVAPARLESTSHILVHGLDIFYTRVAPSKTFDVLKEDFDHRLIVLVLTGLIIASFGTMHLAARKALKQAWK
ncbi:hypothetical protein HUJ04_004063 [Dendroctonus ponderosae]|uniref:ER membrane protein complex subunit 1 n=1 Tax=Dendroctonus ponderosae TaxID=77166 RepID=A0AAR5PZV8_DENPD|nr:hypothetical protein HUJ04_004063 [Dendroctonus ponderosae]